jgi:oxalate decarboxylase
VTQRELPVAATIAGANMRLTAGGVRELHWHKEAEWAFMLAGQAALPRSTATATTSSRTHDGCSRLKEAVDCQAGDVGYVLLSVPHFVENTGDEPLRFLELFRADRFVDISLAQWMALTPHELAQAHLGLPLQMIDTMRKDKQPVV